MYLAFIIFSIIIVILIFDRIRMIAQVKKLADQVNFHRNNDSNIDFSLDVYSKDLKMLCDELQMYKEATNERKKVFESHEEQIKKQIMDISHDIRTPLTSISGYIQMLQETNDEEKKRRYYEIIQERLSTMNVMLDDFFTYSKISNNVSMDKMEIVDVKRVLTDILLSYYDVFNEKKIHVDLKLDESNAKIYASEEDIRRLIMNLTKNILNHGNDECHISMTNNEKTVQIRFVNSTNSSIPQNPNQVFERYYRGDSARSSQSSTGLGLAIVKGLVERNNGSIECFIPDNNRFGIDVVFDLWDM